MYKLKLTSINPGNYSKEKVVYERLKTFNNAHAIITSSLITVKSKDRESFSSNLIRTEEDFATETFQGQFEDGTIFRLIKPAGIARIIMQSRKYTDTISFGSMSGDGYAVQFDLLNDSEPDSDSYNDSSNIVYNLSMESKAETLVLTANSLHEFNPAMARDHISRFMKLLNENEIEILKFENIQNIILGYILAIRLSIIDETTANKKIADLKFRFHSKDHLRYENGIHVSGPHGGAGRGIEIIPNFELKEGYLVTIYNMDGNHPFWGNNIQMASKQMKIIEKQNDKIQLRGFGNDYLGNSFSGYAITVSLVVNEIDHITLHIIDREIEIKYLN